MAPEFTGGGDPARSVALLWRHREHRPSRGRKPTLTVDAIVAAAIEMAHALGMVAAAEGVETEAQLVRLAELGCDLAQGFHLARPAPAERLNLGGLAVIQGYAASQPA